MRSSNFQRTYYIYVHTNKLPIHASIYALNHSQVLYIYYKLLQCRCLHFIETRIQILHYSSRKQVHSIIQTNLNANCSSTSLLCFYIDVYICSRQLLNIYWIILLSYVSNSMPTYFTLSCLVLMPVPIKGSVCLLAFTPLELPFFSLIPFHVSESWSTLLLFYEPKRLIVIHDVNSRSVAPLSLVLCTYVPTYCSKSISK